MKAIKILIFSFLIFITTANSVLAGSFNPSFIISDEEMFNYNSMSWADIQNFLNNKEGILKNYSTKDYNGKTMEASAIIYLAAKEHKINPKVLLTKLQHEASLITNPKPSDTSLTWAMGYGVCDDCSIWDPNVSFFGGFGQQVDYMARIMRKYTDKPELYNYKVGDKKTFKDKIGNVYPPYNKITVNTDVTFSNIATKNLYTYTPHVYTYFYKDKETGEIKYVGGNYNFWKIWNGWFGKTYPDGSLLQIKADDPVATAEEKKAVWLIANNQKRAFASKAVFSSSYSPSKIIFVGKKDLDTYETGYSIKYPNYSILSAKEGENYLIINNKKRLISSPEVFKSIGFNPEEIVQVEEKELELYDDSTPITEYSIYPAGAILQNTETKELFYVESSLKQQIVDQSILKTNFPNQKIIKATPTELNRYLTGSPVKFKDGNLISVKGEPTVYVIANGLRRPISSGKVFEDLGYDWDNIIETTPLAVEIHTLGDPIK